MSNFRHSKQLLVLAALSASAVSSADWVLTCPGPKTNRFSNDFGAQFLVSPIAALSCGISGTLGYLNFESTGVDDPPGCLPSDQTGSVRGRIGFGTGIDGSVHTSRDDLMSLTWGFSYAAPGVMGRFGYATVQEDGTSTLFGGNAINLSFTGESDNYFYARTVNGSIQIELRGDLVADASRLEWILTNVSTASHTVGMRFGQHVALQDSAGASVGTGYTLGVSNLGYVTVPGVKPPKTERRWSRAVDPSGFPNFVNFNWSQEEGYGLRVENAPSAATTDATDSTGSQTQVDAFVLGSSRRLLGTWDGGDSAAFPDFIFATGANVTSDVGYLDDVAYIQTWNPTTVPAGSSRKIVGYYRTTWGDSQYGRPYSVTVDTPKVINVNALDPTTFDSNPFTIRVWVDNNRGFSTVDQEIPIQDVKVDLLLPDGLTAIGGASRTINRVEARSQGFVDFTVRADDTAAGELSYQVKVTPTPGPVKTVNGVISVVSQPRLILAQNANLVASPWTFEQPVWEAILGLQADQDFTAFRYDPVQKGYVLSTGPVRGQGAWVIAKAGQTLALGGTPTAPTDFKPTGDGTGGAPLITLKQGWNLIGNPYHVGIELGQIVGASNSNPTSSFTFAQLVQSGLVSGSLAFWDTVTQNYSFIQRTTDRIEPQRGYWIYCNSSQDVLLRFPPVYQTNVRSTTTEASWQQTANQWRLQLAARSANAADDQNFVGIASSAAESKKHTVIEPPVAPIKDAVSLSFDKQINGSQTRVATSLSETGGRQEFKVFVDVNSAGPITLTWPNLATIPKNVRARLVDTVTGETRDLRKFSGYTFQAEAQLTREFKIQLEPGVAAAPVIGNVVLNRSGRANGADSMIRFVYTLSTDVTTTVRILSGTGREVSTITRGRADKAGQNEVTWNLRDQANRSVAPGSYRAEILVEGNDGERTRKVVPFVITR